MTTINFTQLTLVFLLLPCATLLHAADRVEPKMSYLDNGTIRIGVDLHLGGSITHLSKSTMIDSQPTNIVNNHDWGRQIQMSHYSGPVPYSKEDKKPAKVWAGLGWNPIQSGDFRGHRAQVLEHTNDGQTMFTRCRPMHWPLNNVPGECIFETRITLDGHTARVTCRILNERDDHTQYAGRGQELPAVYTIGKLHRLFTYSGEQPFAGEAPTQVQYSIGDKFPKWSYWQATERWAALVDDNNWGLGIWNPRTTAFCGGFFGQPGQGTSRENPTGYIAPLTTEILDHNIDYSYDYTLILGTLDEIRDYVHTHAARPTLPDYNFAHNRQGWTYVAAHDTGWPIRGELHITPDAEHSQLIGPADAWLAKDAQAITISGAFQTATTTARLYWATATASDFAEDRSIAFEVQPDGQSRDYKLDLSQSPNYTGLITKLRIDLPASPKEETTTKPWLKLSRISAQP